MSTQPDPLLQAARRLLESLPTLTLTLQTGKYVVSLQVRRVDDGDTATASPPAPDLPRHSEDFRSVYAQGKTWAFTKPQAQAVRVLWDAWEAKIPDVTQQKLLDVSGTASTRISDVFRAHVSWGTLIVLGGSRGTYRLNLPSEP